MPGDPRFLSIITVGRPARCCGGPLELTRPLTGAQLTTYAQLSVQSGCEEIMTSPGPITVFAPNDDAFGAFLKKVGKSKMEIMDDPALPAVIKSHIVEGTFKLENMPEGTTLTTIGGTTLTVSGGAVNGSKFKKNDIKVDNAVLHAVDAVIEA